MELPKLGQLPTLGQLPALGQLPSLPQLPPIDQLPTLGQQLPLPALPPGLNELISTAIGQVTEVAGRAAAVANSASAMAQVIGSNSGKLPGEYGTKAPIELLNRQPPTNNTKTDLPSKTISQTMAQEQFTPTSPQPSIATRPLESPLFTDSITPPSIDHTTSLPPTVPRAIAKESHVPSSRFGRVMSFANLAVGVSMGAAFESIKSTVRPTKTTVTSETHIIDDSSAFLSDDNMERVVG